MGIIKNLWELRKTYGSPPKPMGIIKNLWESRKTYGRHPKPMEVILNRGSQTYGSLPGPKGVVQTCGIAKNRWGISQIIWELAKTYGNNSKPMGITKNLWE